MENESNHDICEEVEYLLLLAHRYPGNFEAISASASGLARHPKTIQSLKLIREQIHGGFDQENVDAIDKEILRRTTEAGHFETEISFDRHDTEHPFLTTDALPSTKDLPPKLQRDMSTRQKALARLATEHGLVPLEHAYVFAFVLELPALMATRDLSKDDANQLKLVIQKMEDLNSLYSELIDRNVNGHVHEAQVSVNPTIAEILESQFHRNLTSAFSGEIQTQLDRLNPKKGRQRNEDTVWVYTAYKTFADYYYAKAKRLEDDTPTKFGSRHRAWSREIWYHLADGGYWLPREFKYLKDHHGLEGYRVEMEARIWTKEKSIKDATREASNAKTLQVTPAANSFLSRVYRLLDIQSRWPNT